MKNYNYIPTSHYLCSKFCIPIITYVHVHNYVIIIRNDVLYSVIISSNVYLLQFEKIRSFGEEEDEQEEEEKAKEMDFYHLCTTQTENNDALSK